MSRSTRVTSTLKPRPKAAGMCGGAQMSTSPRVSLVRLLSLARPWWLWRATTTRTCVKQTSRHEQLAQPGLAVRFMWRGLSRAPTIERRARLPHRTLREAVPARRRRSQEHRPFCRHSALTGLLTATLLAGSARPLARRRRSKEPAPDQPSAGLGCDPFDALEGDES